MLKRTRAARSPVKLKLPHSGGHTAEIRSEIAPEMAENSNNSMGDELPREIENSLYRYLIVISKLRLGILTEQGEGS